MNLPKQIQDNGKTGAKYIVFQNLGNGHPDGARIILGRYKTLKQAKLAHPDATDWTKKNLSNIFKKAE